jgi:cytochrome c
MLELMKKYNKAALMAVGLAIASTSYSFTGIGTDTSAKETVTWDISVFYDGENLPAGVGTLEDGEELYNARCAMCHGDFGEGANKYPKLLGAEVEDLVDAAVDGENNVMMRGVNNYWGHAPTLFDTIRRAMPYFAPQSLTDDQTYSLTGYVLVLAEIMDEDIEEINAETLKSIKMPGEKLFVTDNRPDTYNTRCMTDCISGDVEYTYNVMAEDE